MPSPCSEESGCRILSQGRLKARPWDCVLSCSMVLCRVPPLPVSKCHWNPRERHTASEGPCPREFMWHSRVVVLPWGPPVCSGLLFPSRQSNLGSRSSQLVFLLGAASPQNL